MEALPICTICHDDFSHNRGVGGLPCGHIFHRGCLESWIQRWSNCPQCREKSEINQIYNIHIHFEESTASSSSYEEVKNQLREQRNENRTVREQLAESQQRILALEEKLEQSGLQKDDLLNTISIWRQRTVDQSREIEEKRKEIIQLMQKCDHISKEHENVTKQLQTQVSVVLSPSMAAMELNSQLINKNNVLTSVLTELNVKLHAFQEIEVELSAKTKLISDLQSTMRLNNQEFTELQKENIKLRTELVSLKKRPDPSEVNKLKQQADEVIRLTDLVNLKNKQAEEFWQKKRQHDRYIHELEMQRHELKEKMEELHGNLKEKNKENTQLQGIIRAREEENVHLRKELENTAKEITMTKNENKEKMSSLQTEIEIKNIKLLTFKKQEITLQQKSKQIDNIKRRMAILEKGLEKKDTEILKLHEDFDTLKLDHQEQLGDLKHQVNRLEQELELKNNEVKTLRTIQTNSSPKDCEHQGSSETNAFVGNDFTKILADKDIIINDLKKSLNETTVDLANEISKSRMLLVEKMNLEQALDTQQKKANNWQQNNTGSPTDSPWRSLTKELWTHAKQLESSGYSVFHRDNKIFAKKSPDESFEITSKEQVTELIDDNEI